MKTSTDHLICNFGKRRVIRHDLQRHGTWWSLRIVFREKMSVSSDFKDLLRHLRVDILMSITGLTFDQAWKNRVEADFDGIPVTFISREDLIISKSALGRPQDLIDVALLSQVETSLPKRIKRQGSKKKT